MSELTFSMNELKRIAKQIPRKMIIVPPGVKAELDTLLADQWIRLDVREDRFCAPDTAYIVDFNKVDEMIVSNLTPRAWDWAS